MRRIRMSERGALELAPCEAPQARDDELIVKVEAISVNRGEVLRARAAGPGFEPGWDFAGTVVSTTEGGPPVGSRVAGYRRIGAWAELVAVSPRYVAVVPDTVTLAQAATLPVAGLTALGAIDRGRDLLGRRVLVTGASGGVGSFATNLAALAGADVTAVVRRPAAECAALLVHAHTILTADHELAGAERNGPYDLIVETLGGRALAVSLGLLSSRGKCMTVGVTDATLTSFDAERFFMKGEASLEGFVLFRDRGGDAPSEGLRRLLRLVEKDDLPAEVALSDDWSNLETVAEQLLSRAFIGKAVLQVTA